MDASRETAQLDLITQAYLRVRELIIAGKLAPGTRIIESELAARLEISRTPVRSALQRLQQEGWVVGASEGGRQLRLTVSPLTKDDARELFHIIGTLEGLAAGWAALLPAAERERLVVELRALNRELREAAAGAEPDARQVYELHSEFHARLVAALHAPRLRMLHEGIKPQAYRYRQIYSTELVPLTADAAAEHESVLLGIEAGDPEAAEQAARTNWANAAERMCRIIETWGEKGSW